MSRVIISAVALAGLVVFSACSSTTVETSAKNENVNGVVAVKSGDQVAAPQTVDANSATTTQGDLQSGVATNRLQSKIDAAKKSTEPIDNAAVEAMALKNAKPAPENSTFTSFLTDSGYEIRTFKDNPQLLKVVKIIGAEKSSIKVYLRGGRVVDLTGNAIINLNTVPSSTILAAAGIQPPPVMNLPSSKGDPTKKGQ